MIILTCFKRCAYTIFKPGIIKAIIDRHRTTTVCHRHIITAAKLVQQIGFSIYYTIIPKFFTNIKANASNSTFYSALNCFNAITCCIAVTTKIA